MGIFSNIVEYAVEEDNRTGLTGTNIAVGRAEFHGSVHSGGDVSVEVKRQYGERQDSGITIAASVHGTGDTDLTVKELVDFELIEGQIPTSPIESGKGESVPRRISKNGSVHNYGNLDYHIDRLVIVPDQSVRSYHAEGDDRILRKFAEEGYDVAQELDVDGSVHGRGTLEVTIDELVVME